MLPPRLSLPVGHVIYARWWRVTAEDVPRHAGHENQVQWLYDWWERIDEWISQNRPAVTAPEPSPPGGASPPTRE
jgi:hypothetical protein